MQWGMWFHRTSKEFAMQRRHLIQWGAAALATSSLGAQAQSFPVKPIKLVIAFPAGGAHRHHHARSGR